MRTGELPEGVVLSRSGEQDSRMYNVLQKPRTRNTLAIIYRHSGFAWHDILSPSTRLIEFAGELVDFLHCREYEEAEDAARIRCACWIVASCLVRDLAEELDRS